MIAVSRRRFLQGAGVAALGMTAGCVRLPWQAQPVSRAYRLGLLTPAPSTVPSGQAFLHELRAYGYEEGHNLTVDWRAFEGRIEGVAGQINELIDGHPDVLVTASNPPALAAKAATNSIPIVFMSVSDPVGEGLVASLARPGGNATGTSNLATGLAAKRLEFLKEIVPDASRIAVFWFAIFGRPNLQVQEVLQAAQMLGVEILSLEIGELGGMNNAIAAAARERADALYLISTPFITQIRSAQISEFAIANRLPVVAASRQDAAAGCLFSYGASTIWSYKRGVAYVDKLLKGAKPADLPVEQPREFELVINMQTAKALGLEIPYHVLLQATEVIE